MYDILQVKTGLTVPMIVFWKRRPRKHNKSKLTEKLLLDTGEDYMNEIWEKVYKAYIFSFPLMMMDATMRVSTNTAEPEDISDEEIFTDGTEINQPIQRG